MSCLLGSITHVSVIGSFVVSVVCNRFCHVRLLQVMPQDENNQLYSMSPIRGVPVTVQVGPPVVVDDIIEKYHRDAAARANARKVSGGKSGAKPPPHKVHLISGACATNGWSPCRRVI